MPRYTDTALTQHPFAILAKEWTTQQEDELHRNLGKSRSDFDVNSDDNPCSNMESLEEINNMLLKELGSTLDDMH
jgi:hypothetical protein